MEADNIKLETRDTTILPVNKQKIENFKKELLRDDKSIGTIKLYERILTNFFVYHKHKRYDEIVPKNDVSAFIDYLSEKQKVNKKLSIRMSGRPARINTVSNEPELSKQYKNNIYACLRSFYNSETVDLPEIGKRIKRIKEDDWIPPIIMLEEYKRYTNKNYIENYYKDKHKKKPVDAYYIDRDHLMLMLIYSCGLRRNEIANAKRDWIFGRREKMPQIIVDDRPRMLVWGKGDIRIGLDLSLYWVKLYNEFITKYGEESPYIFTRKIQKQEDANKHLSAVQVGDICKGITGHYPHWLRHGYGTIAVKSNSLITAQRMLRHKQSVTTQKYANIVGDANEDPIRQLDDLMAEKK